MAGFDPREYRVALGAFPTGVTIVTTTGLDGNAVGVTASSFNSVSLDPPLVLWSLAKSSGSLVSFRDSGHFAVHVLTHHQDELSNRFARPGTDKFENLIWQTGKLGSPIFEDYAAKFECQTLHQYEGGDHIIFVGEVVDFERRDRQPLVFHRGRYAETRPRGQQAQESGVELSQGRFSDEFLLYLISRAHYQTSNPVRQVLKHLNLSQAEYLTLSTLALTDGLSTIALQQRLEHTGHAPNETRLAAMLHKSLLEQRDGKWHLTPLSRKRFVEALAVSKAVEDDLLDHFTSAEISDAKDFLRKVINLSDEDLSNLWEPA